MTSFVFFKNFASNVVCILRALPDNSAPLPVVRRDARPDRRVNERIGSLRREKSEHPLEILHTYVHTYITSGKNSRLSAVDYTMVQQEGFQSRMKSLHGPRTRQYIPTSKH